MQYPLKPLMDTIGLVLFFRSLLTKPPCIRARQQFARMFSIDKRYRKRSGSFDARPITFAPGYLTETMGPRPEGGKSNGGKTAGKPIKSRLPYKCRAQSPVKITRSLIRSRGKTRVARNKRFLFVQKEFTCEGRCFFFRDLLNLQLFLFSNRLINQLINLAVIPKLFTLI